MKGVIPDYDNSRIIYNMDFFLKLLHGFLTLRIHGIQLERFINLCRNRGICLEKMEFQNDNTMDCRISIKDFREIQKIRRKTKMKIKIMQKHGMPFFFLHHRKRKAFFLGLCFFISIIWILSGRIWTIQVKGNIRNTTPEIMALLKEEGIYHGIKTKKVDCKYMAEQLRKTYRDITWASVKLAGNHLLIEIKEGIITEENSTQKISGNLIADKSGTIVKMVTRTGTPVKKVGDICEAGEVLISGIVEILNDSKEIVRYDYTTADADIYIKYKIPYYQEIPLTYTSLVPTGKKSIGLELQWNQFDFQIGGKIQDSDTHIFKDYTNIFITDTFRLPVNLIKIHTKEYREIQYIYLKEEAKALALKELHKYEENLIQKGVQIFVNNVTIKFNQKICVSSGYLEVIEKIGIREPILIQEQPIRKDIKK